MSDSTAAINESVEQPARKLGLVKAAGIIGIAGGALMIIVGIIVCFMVSGQLRDEKIVVPDDALAFQGQTVAGPFTAYVQADIIQQHALKISGGKTYAELDREDPVRVTMMNASFLRTSLFTSVVSFGVAFFAMGTGALSILFGWSIFRLASTPVVVRRGAVSKA